MGMSLGQLLSRGSLWRRLRTYALLLSLQTALKNSRYSVGIYLSITQTRAGDVLGAWLHWRVLVN
jgi:hypothetical protein